MSIEESVFLKCVETLKERYEKYHFFTERDIVWTIQKMLIKNIKDKGLKVHVYNEYNILNKKRVDLVILPDLQKNANSKKIGLEFKYEPSHNRIKDYPKSKLKQDFVFWKTGVLKDIQKAESLVNDCLFDIAYAIFIDEDSHFKKRYSELGQKAEIMVCKNKVYQTSIILSKAKKN